MDIRERLQLLLDQYADAYREGDSERCAAIFTQNARLISPYGPTIEGRDAIRQAHLEWTKAGADGKALKVTEAGVSGDLAWCLAVFSEGNGEGQGTSLNILERQSDGSWLIRVSSLNEPPPDAASRNE